DSATDTTEAPIVDGMTPRVVKSKLSAQAREGAAIQAELKGRETRMAAIFANVECRDITVQPRAARVIWAERGNTVSGKPSGDAVRIQQPTAAIATVISYGIKSAAARTQVGHPSDKTSSKFMLHGCAPRHRIGSMQVSRDGLGVTLAQFDSRAREDRIL